MPPTLRAPKPTVQRLTRWLREDFAPSGRVDKAAGIIHGVKILGRSSPNRHGIDGISGTEYTLEALRAAAPLYEGVGCYRGHPPRHSPEAERDPADRIGWIQSVEAREDGLYGDLHLLTSDPFCAKLLEAAEKNQLIFALSHNAQGQGDVREGKYVVTEIPRVRSVDVVCEGGTNRGLFESRESKPMKKSFRALVEAASADVQKHLRPLLEDDVMGYGDTMVEDPLPAEGEEETGDNHRSILGDLLDAIVNDPDLSDAEVKAKVIKALDVLDAGGGADTTEGEEEDKDKLESRERQELVQLRAEKACRTLCESLEFGPTSLQLKMLAGLPEGERRAAIKELKAAVTPRGSNAPRTGPDRRATLESAALAGTKEQLAKALLG